MQADERCRNCGAVLRGSYCSDCGQRADARIVSLWQFIGDVLDDLLNLDSRLWRTLLPLLVRPGRLTSDYLDGKRASYLPPFRTYLILSLIFFVTAAVLSVDWQLSVTRASPDVAERLPTADPVEDTNPCEAEIDLAELGPLANTEWEARIRAACEKIVADSGDSLQRAIVDNIPTMMFFFIPLVALGMKCLYPLSRPRYVEHLLFLFHFHAFFFLTLTLIVMVSWLAHIVPALELPATILTGLGWTYIPIYLFMALRRVYRQGRVLTALKYILLLLGYAVTLGVVFIVVLAYSALTL